VAQRAPSARRSSQPPFFAGARIRRTRCSSLPPPGDAIATNPAAVAGRRIEAEPIFQSRVAYSSGAAPRETTSSSQANSRSTASCRWRSHAKGLNQCSAQARRPSACVQRSPRRKWPSSWSSTSRRCSRVHASASSGKSTVLRISPDALGTNPGPASLTRMFPLRPSVRWHSARRCCQARPGRRVSFSTSSGLPARLRRAAPYMR
jgi:hypothetical protein